MKRLCLGCGCLLGLLAASFCQSPPAGAPLQEPQAAPPVGKAKKVWTNDDFPERRPPPAPPAAPGPRKPAKLDVPFVPTPMEVVDVMLQLAELKSGDVLYDLGSGDGRIVIAAARQHGIKGVGVDIDPVRIKEAEENARKAGVTDLAAFRENDLFQEDISKATVVTLYLSPGVNLKLRPKLLKELKPGSRVISHDFSMGNWAPDKEVQVRLSRVFHWVIPVDASTLLLEPETAAAGSSAPARPASGPPVPPVSASAPAGRTGGYPGRRRRPSKSRNRGSERSPSAQGCSRRYTKAGQCSS